MPELVRVERREAIPVVTERPREEDLAQIFFTSGTTGRSKACLFDHRYAVRQAERFVAARLRGRVR